MYDSCSFKSMISLGHVGVRKETLGRNGEGSLIVYFRLQWPRMSITCNEIRKTATYVDINFGAAMKFLYFSPLPFFLVKRDALPSPTEGW